MQCEKCGATLGFGADDCAQCGAPVDRPAGAAAPIVVDPVVASPTGVNDRVTAPPSSRPTWLVPVVAAIAIVLIAAGGYFMFKGLSGANGPDAAAVRMMNGLADYDATAILDNVTHGSFTATDQAQFAQQTAENKKDNKGLAYVKNIKVVSVTVDPKDPNAAMVKLSADWLDVVKGTYAARTDSLSLVKQNGKWLVRLFP
jgi:hypothetical protein